MSEKNCHSFKSIDMHVKCHELRNISVRVLIHVPIHVTCMTNLIRKILKLLNLIGNYIMKVRNDCIFWNLPRGLETVFEKNTQDEKVVPFIAIIGKYSATKISLPL